MQQTPQKLAGAEGLEPSNGGIKIRDHSALSICSDDATPHNPPTLCPALCPPWPARTTIKRTFRALERWIEDRKGDLSGIEYQIARDALHAVGELDQSNAETMTLIVDSARARLMTFIETFKGRSFDVGSPSIVPGPTTITLATMLETVIEGIDGA